jgi:tetratricopeptide (TPR) repeat protein
LITDILNGGTMLKKIAIALMMLAATGISYADTQDDVTKVTQEIETLFENKNYMQCVLLIDRVVSVIEAVLQDKSAKRPQKEIAYINKYLSELWLIRARCHALTNAFKLALDDCEKALQKNKDYGYAYFIKGAIFLRMNNVEEGVKYIKIAAQKGHKPAQDFIAKNNL